MGNAGSAPEQAKKAEAEGGAEGGGGVPPSTVRFFPGAAQHTARQPPPIKLEEEDVPPPPGTAAEEEVEMAPRNLWQVYALGAFIVLRWGWAKWKESKDRDDPADGQSPDGSS